MNDKEFILCAAIWINDQLEHKQQPFNIKIGYVVCGRRHHNCYQTIVDLKGDLNTYFKTLNISKEDYRKHQGFITSLDRYVDRAEAWSIAKNSNQIRFGLETSEEEILISENLY